MRKYFFLVTILILSFFVNCSRDKWSGRIYKQSGVTIVENYGPGLWREKIGKRISFVKELSIGKESGEDYLMFLNDIDISVDSDLNIYVLDMGNHRLIKFNKNGDHIHTIGREGQGPGELQKPSQIMIDQLQKIYILDNNFNIHLYDIHGKYEKTFKLESPVESFQRMQDGTFFARVEIPQQTGLAGAYYSNDLKFLKPFSINYPYGPKISGGGNIGGDLRCIRDKIFMVLPDKYEIREYDLNGNLLRKIMRDFDFEPPLVKRLQGGFAIGGKTKLGPCFLDRNELIINEVFQIKGNSEKDFKMIFSLDFFNPDGKFLGSFLLPEWTKLITIDSDNKYYFVTLDPIPSVIRSSIIIH